MNPIIIDTDPGVDDALAIMLAVKSELNILGITTTYGNSTVKDSTSNALMLVELLKADIPVYQGASKPFRGRGLLAKSHGANGAGGLQQTATNNANSQSAVEFMAQTLRRNAVPVDIVAIGPLTNIAQLIAKHPSVIPKIGKITLMGGVFNEPGNTTQYAEFNAYNDPIAMQTVLHAPIKKVVVPANVCKKVVLSIDELAGFTNPDLQQNIRQLTTTYIDYYTKKGRLGGVMYDMLAVGYILCPEFFVTTSRKISVITKPSKRYGQTIFSRTGHPCTLVEDVDSDRVKALFFTNLNTAQAC